MRIILLLALSLAFSHSYAQNCAAPLNGGTANSSASNICGFQYFGINITGASTGNGLTYQWESSADNITWTDMPGFTNITLSTQQNSNTWYRRRMTCAGGGQAWSTSIQITTKPYADCWCTPSGSSCNNGFQINNVSFASINNNSACGTSAYTNYTPTVAAASIMRGSIIPITVTVATGNSSRFVQCFIDYNQNGDFDQNELQTLAFPTGNVYSGHIRVPFGAKLGATRLRLQFNSGGTYSCYPDLSSETEDYAINITANTTGATGHVIYVKPFTGGASNGVDWANALSSVRSAVAIATPGDTIKVAAGNYFGASQTNGITLKDSITILGGYPATGNPTNAQRNPGQFHSTLYGGTSATATNNDFHIFYASNVKGTTIDGFILQNGGNYYGNGNQTLGGGIFANLASTITMKNCVFRNHHPNIHGSSAYAHASTINFVNCIFTGSETDQYTALFFEKGAEINFSNAVIARNNTGHLIYSDSSKVVFRNSTIAHNNSYLKVSTITNQSQVSFINSISFYNALRDYYWTRRFDSVDFSLNNSTATLNNSLMQAMTGGTSLLLGSHPKFIDTSSIAGADGFYFTADDGFNLQNPCSPALNAGSNTEVGTISTDIKGQSRIFGAKVDLGAYEVQQAALPLPTTVYVNAAATGANNGTSWANAFTDMHKALQTCSDTIKVAGGTYYPWKSTANTSYYWIENKRVIYGSYPPTGNPTDANRNYDTYPTIISGMMLNNERAGDVIKGQGLDSTSILDGFRFAETGNTNYTFDAAFTYSGCNNPIISNCSFTNNLRRAVVVRNSKNPRFLNCKVYDNIPFGNSYGIELFVFANNEKLTMKNVLFTGNRMTDYTGISGEHGRLLILNNTHAVIDSCQFVRNRATVMGIFFSNPIITNTKFIANHAGENTIDLENYYANPQFSNCYFRDSAWSYFSSEYGGHMNNYVSNPVFTNCQFYGGSAYRTGGVAYNDSSDAKFINCIFNNSTTSFYNKNGSDMELINCISIGSEQSWLGNGSFMYNSRSNPTITNTVVTKAGGGTYGVIVNDNNSVLKINNSIFWKNFGSGGNLPTNAGDRVEIKNNNGSTTIIKNSMMELYDGGAVNNNMVKVDPRFANYRHPIGPDSTWFTADDGLRLCDCSPAINTGDNALNTTTVDLTLQPRVTGAAIDRGAYELQTTPQPTIKTAYVAASATGSNTGSSWNNAYTSLQSAFANPCVDSIKIAGGVYTPSALKRDTGFLVDRSLVIKGSYTPNTDLQDVEATPSILSGNIGTADSSDNNYGVIKAFYVDTLILDQLVIADANRSNNYGSFMGGVYAHYLQYLGITNSRIRNNTARNGWGGGLSITQAKAFEISKTVFSNNFASSGAGLYFDYNGSPKRIVDCVFENNHATFEGGGAYVGDNGGSAFINCVFTHNKAVRGSGMGIDNNADVLVENCTFNSNLLTTGGSYGAGIYSSGASWQGGGAGPFIRNCIFTENTFESLAGTGQQYLYHDVYYPKNGYHPNGQVDLRIHHSAVTTSPEYYYGGGNIGPSQIVYKNKTNPIGPDGKWFTADDGLQMSVCSDGVNKGSNAAVTSTKDILGNQRIINTTVDMGAYEYNGSPIWTGLLNQANDSLVANKEVTDNLGWTHYYRNCTYLMSIKKAGQNIGTIGDGSFEVKIVTAPGYNSGAAANLTAAAYNTTGQPWYVMNRYWKVKPTSGVTDSILIRFPYTNADFKDVKGSNLSVTQHTQLEFFKVNAAEPFDLTVPASGFFRYAYSGTPTTNKWTYGVQDSIHVADYYVKSFSGGGGGAWYTGALPDLTITSSSANVSTIGTGGTVTVTYTEANTGTGAAGSHKVQFYLSADNVFNKTNDSLMASHTITILNAGSNTGSLSKQVTIPCGITPGNYYLFVVADGAGQVEETNEGNNTAFHAITVTTGLGMPVTPVITVNPATLCAGTPATLTASSAGCTSCTYTWSNGSTGASITVSGSGTYIVTATNACGSVTASKSISFDPGPSINITGGPGTLCVGALLTLNATGADTYTWTGNGLNATTGSSVTANPTSPGQQSYTVTGTKNGCSSTRTALVTVNPAANITVTPANPVICAGGSVTLNAAGAENVNWSPATGLNTTQGFSVIASPTVTTTYTITGTSIFGCAGSTTKTVTVSGAQTTPSVSINYTGCPTSTLTFTATPVNAGSSNIYEWWVNGVMRQSNASNIFILNNAINGMHVQVRMYVNLPCFSSPYVDSERDTVNCSITSLPSIDALEEFSVSPNPSSGPFTVKMKLSTVRTVGFTITDANGNTIYQSQQLRASGSFTHLIQLKVVAGVYYLRTRVGTETFVEKIVVIR